MRISFIQKVIDIARNKKENAYVRGKHASVAKSAAIGSHCNTGDYTPIGRDVDITKTQIGRYCRKF